MLRIQAKGEFFQVVRVLFSYNSWHSKEIALYRFLFLFTLTKLRCLVSWESPQNGLHGDKLPWKDANHDLTNKLKFQIFFFNKENLRNSRKSASSTRRWNNELGCDGVKSLVARQHTYLSKTSKQQQINNHEVWKPSEFKSTASVDSPALRAPAHPADQIR